MGMITIKEYAVKHGISPITARKRAQRGAYKTAVKVGRDWLIDPDEPHLDHRTSELNTRWNHKKERE